VFRRRTSTFSDQISRSIPMETSIFSRRMFQFPTGRAFSPAVLTQADRFPLRVRSRSLICKLVTTFTPVIFTPAISWPVEVLRQALGVSAPSGVLRQLVASTQLEGRF